MNQIIEAYVPFAATLEALVKRYASAVFDLTTSQGFAEAKKARAELRTCRTNVEETRQELKKPVLEQGRAIDKQAKDICDQLLAMETPLDVAITAEEERRKKEKDARELAERERISALQGRIDKLRSEVVVAMGLDASGVAAKIAEITAIDIDDSFGEFQKLAKMVRNEVLDRLNDIQRAKDAAEAERKAIESARAALQAEREALETARTQPAGVIPGIPTNQRHPLRAVGGVLPGLRPIPQVSVDAATCKVVALHSSSDQDTANIANDTVVPQERTWGECKADLDQLALQLTVPQLESVLAYARQVGDGLTRAA